MNTENLQQIKDSLPESDIVYRLLKRAEIRRSIPTRKSVQEGKPDRIAELLEQAAEEIYELRLTFIESINERNKIVNQASVAATVHLGVTTERTQHPITIWTI